ncbi:hypothetical protein CR513_40706, partial [Mucuna pruriens]
MEQVIKMIKKNNTWELVDCPHGKDIIEVKWVYKTKLNLYGTIQKHKARLVVKGYSQQPRIDYIVATQKGWSIYQLDVKSIFLNGVLEEKIHVEQLEGFINKGNEDKVLRLRKSLYGLKQAPRAWYNRIDHDRIYIGNNVKMINDFKEDMMKTFKMTNLDLMNYFLKIVVRQQKERIFICQKNTEALLKKFKMYDCKFVTTPLRTNEKLQKDDKTP